MAIATSTGTGLFGAKTRVTFNSVDLIDLDSLEYPPTQSDNDADDDDEHVARVQFTDEVLCSQCA